MLLKDPESGPVMTGTGGIRKVRFAFDNQGRSSKKQEVAYEFTV